jgi:hypothetical protein
VIPFVASEFFILANDGVQTVAQFDKGGCFHDRFSWVVLKVADEFAVFIVYGNREPADTRFNLVFPSVFFGRRVSVCDYLRRFTGWENGIGVKVADKHDSSSWVG